MAGRPPRTEAVKGVYIRIPPALQARVEHCQWLLQRQHGPRVTLNDAFRQTIEAGCEVLEGTLEGKEIPAPAQTPIADIAQIAISKLAEIAGEDFSVPGYGFPEDTDEDETPHRNGAAQVADTEQAAAPAPQPELPAAPVQTEELPEVIEKIADARAEHFRMSERTFAQYLYDNHIYRHRSKDGREVPIPHTTLRKWLQQAREAGLL
jgi:hypothetical protein